MQRKKNKGLKITIIILAILLALSLVFLAVIYIYNAVSPKSTVTAVVSNNVLTSEVDVSSNRGANNESSSVASSNAEITSSAGAVTSTVANKPDNPIGSFTFFNRHTEYNTAFRVVNMFPGDREIKNYSVKVEHKSSIVLHFSAEIRSGYEKLAEVLNCRVVLPDDGEVLYDGLMRDMPESLEHLLATKTNVTNYVDYEVTAYLDTSVGNEYMNKDLYADFRFWADEAEMSDLIANGIYDPEYLIGENGDRHWYDKVEDILSAATGDNSITYIVVIIAACSLFLLILLSIMLKKEGTNNEKEE